jgi:hypothetical protein
VKCKMCSPINSLSKLDHSVLTFFIGSAGRRQGSALTSGLAGYTFDAWVGSLSKETGGVHRDTASLTAQIFRRTSRSWQNEPNFPFEIKEVAGFCGLLIAHEARAQGRRP